MASNQIGHAVRLAWRDSLQATLCEASRERDLRQGLVTTAAGEMACEWAVYERSVMLGAVNRLRSVAKLAPVALAAVERVERQAAGHVDYAEKFALYCAELALSEEG